MCGNDLQHATAEADQAIADALDKRIERSKKTADDGSDDDDDGSAGLLGRTGQWHEHPES
jgi:hypothetical protein